MIPGKTNKGLPVAVVFSYSVTESMSQLLACCWEPIQTICTHTAGSKANSVESNLHIVKKGCLFDLLIKSLLISPVCSWHCYIFCMKLLKDIEWVKKFL